MINSQSYIERGLSPERSIVDDKAKPCVCGAQPLLTDANGAYYMSCPPCWVRGHAVASPALARQQWTGMINCLWRFS